MKAQIVILIAKQFFKKTFNSKGLLVLWCVFLMALAYVTISGWRAFEEQHHIIDHHQEESRESWDNNPDKHPHRMAHFGSFAFREQHPLRIFDSGIENYTGNAVFLEAHQQNTANFSQASLSTGLIRFGDLNIAMLLQIILPLIIFFVGYASITSERMNGTLRIIYLQGANMKAILLGKTLGLFLITCLFFIPAMVALWSISFLEHDIINSQIATRSTYITIAYTLFFMLLCCITVIISATSENSNKALLSLLGLWLLLFIIIPKTAQVLGNYWYPNPSKIEFRTAIEEEVSKTGDSHNPDDPYFNKLRDSVLAVHKVTDVKDLPFNYSGFIMSKGEKQTALIYNKEHKLLIDKYRDQNSITQSLVWLNPYLAVKEISMGLSSTDFNTYVNFLSQTEAYRYKQSQYMNELQMKYISNKAKGSEGKVHVIDSSLWKSFPDFKYEYISISDTLSNKLMAIVVLIFWLLLAVGGMLLFSNRFKIS